VGGLSCATQRTHELLLRVRSRGSFFLNCTDADVLDLRISPAGEVCKLQVYNPDWSECGLALLMDGGGVLQASNTSCRRRGAVLEMP